MLVHSKLFRVPGGRLVPLLAALLPLSASGPAASRVTDDEGVWVTWQKKKFHTSEPTSSIDEWAAKAAREWAGFAKANDYELFLADDQRVLLVISGKKRSDELALIEKTCEFLDETIRPPAEKPRVKAIPAGADPAQANDGDPLGVVTMVLVRVEDEEDMTALVNYCTELRPHLRAWSVLGSSTAFYQQSPLCAAWLEMPEGLVEDEWQTENELVHRLTHLIRLREYGVQPNWLAMGLAWYVEEELLSSIYCMPNRETLVEKKEHKAWERDLRKLYKKHEDPVRIEDLTELAAGTWDKEAALRAWGAVRYLAQYRPEALPLVLADLRMLWETKGVESSANGSWRRLPGFEVSNEDQLAVLKKHAGPEVMAEMGRFFEKGRTFRPK